MGATTSGVVQPIVSSMGSISHQLPLPSRRYGEREDCRSDWDRVHRSKYVLPPAPKRYHMDSANQLGVRCMRVYGVETFRGTISYHTHALHVGATITLRHNYKTDG